MSIIFEKFPLSRNAMEEGFHGPGADLFAGLSPRQILYPPGLMSASLLCCERWAIPQWKSVQFHVAT